jgi:hypothetical protein
VSEWLAYVYWQYESKGTFKPTWPIYYVHNGNTLIIGYNTPSGALTFDTSLTSPHLSGTYSAFANGHGFESYSGGFGGTPVTISSSSIAQNSASGIWEVTLVMASSFDSVAYAMVSDLASSSTTGVCPAGRCGTLRDSLGWKGPLSGSSFFNWGIGFYQNGI